ncbi:terminase large subunit domain-containing protein, partial [Stieleria sp.]|uniref:terminase large subunit domain-containing protein n=1 Tax=Stieleria sp. TaxID=2795976 RepID=UPI003569E8C6
MWFPACLRHVEGEWADKPVELTDNQAFIVWCLMGWRRSDGCRRFRHAYITCGRKWGKSTVAAGIGLLLLTCDDPLEKGAQIYCAATKEDQAKIVHGLAKAMADGSPEVRKQVNVLAKSIVTKKGSYQPNSFFKPLGSDSRTSDGFNVHAAVLDEIHEWGDHHKGLWDKLNTAHGSRRQPLIITITTAGDDQSKLWIEVDTLSCRVLDGYKLDNPPGDHRFCFIARLDEKRPCDCGAVKGCPKCEGTGEIPEDDPFDEKNWAKANPNYPVTPKREFMQEQADDAQLSPAGLHVFKRYHCNVLVSSLEKAIHDETWRAAQGEFSDWSDADAICGAWDMGGQDDLAALGFCARFDTGEDEIDTKTGEPTGRPLYRYEVDSVGFINTSAERDLSKEPWADWVDQKLLRVSSMEINEMRQEVIREYQDNQIRSWAYDPANSRDFAQSLEPEGIETVKFFQNAGMWTEPITKFLADLKLGRVRHEGNGLLTWAAGNMVLVNGKRS